jgi:hypothetical protein
MRWILALGLAGCATSAAPYRFSSGLISGISAKVEIEGDADEARPSRRDQPRRATATATASPRPRHRVARTTSIERGDLPLAGDPLPREERSEQSASGVVLSRLPSPHRTDGPTPAMIPPTVADLRALTGTRVTDEPLAFALDAASALTRHQVTPMPADGEAFAIWAATHATVVTETRPGDLVIFDRAIANQPASLVAVALGRDDRGVIEILYVAAGVVRRGFVDPAHPKVARDNQRRTRNTFLRHGKDWPPRGTRYLTGELLAAIYRLQ